MDKEVKKGSEGKTVKKAEKFKMPDTYLIIVGIMIFAALLTYIIPAGVYGNKIDPVTGKEILDSTTFQYVKNTPTTLIQFLLAFSHGLTKQGSMILNVILICGCFHVVNETKGLSNFFSFVIAKLHAKALLIIPIIMILFGFLGSSGALVNSTIAFIPIGLVIACQLGMDRVFAMAIIYLSTFAGFGSSFMSINSVQVAQQIADLPVLSGSGFRMAVSVVIVTAAIIYTMIYCFRVRKDPTKSVLYGTSAWGFDDVEKDADFDAKLTIKDSVICILTFGSFGLFVWGAINKDWGQDMMAAFMVFSAVASGLLSGMTCGQAAIVMPIMAPLSDIVGLSRQVAVLAYQYGDGLSNTIFPVSSSLVASLAIAGVPFQKWLKFQIPLFLIWVVIASAAISIAVMIGYC